MGLSEARYAEAARYRWNKGDLKFLLRPGQVPAYDFFKAAPTGVETVLCMHRGSGKTHLEVVLACEFALTHPGTTTHFVGQTRQDALEYVLAIFEKVFESAHVVHKPKWDAASNCFKFHNGARVLIYGGDMRVDTKRGRDVDCAFVDEVGFFSAPNEIIDDVLMPRILLYGGKLMLASTPPKSTMHPYALKISQAEKDGTLFRYTVYDNPTISEKQIELFAKKAGGYESTTFRREYKCEVVTDEKYAVFPEFTRESSRKLLTSEWKSFPAVIGVHCDFSGTTSGLLAYRDTALNRLICVSAFSLRKASLHDVKASIRRMAEEHGSLDGTIAYCDGSETVVNDVASSMPLPVVKAKKSNISDDVAHIKSIVLMKRLSIAEQCEALSAELDGAIWNESGKNFDTNGHGSAFDVVKALCIVAGEFPELTSENNHEPDHARTLRVFAGMAGEEYGALRANSILEQRLNRGIPHE